MYAVIIDPATDKQSATAKEGFAFFFFLGLCLVFEAVVKDDGLACRCHNYMGHNYISKTTALPAVYS